MTPNQCANQCAAANGGGPSQLQSARLVAAVAWVVRRMKVPAIFASMITFAALSLGQTNAPATLYVHFGFESSDSTKRLLSARIRLGEAIFVGGDDYWKLTGSIERRGTNLVADLNGSTGLPEGFLIYSSGRIFHWIPMPAFRDTGNAERFAELAKSKVRDYVRPSYGAPPALSRRSLDVRRH
jgi:hypothetical protein